MWHRSATKSNVLFCNEESCLKVLQECSSLLLSLFWLYPSEKYAQHIYCHPKIFEPTWYLSELALNFTGVGNKFSGIVPSIQQRLPDVQSPQSLVSVCPRTHTTVGSWKPSLWPMIIDYNSLSCYVKGLLEKFIQAWNMLDYWKYWIIYLFHVLDVPGTCCK